MQRFITAIRAGRIFAFSDSTPKDKVFNSLAQQLLAEGKQIEEILQRERESLTALGLGLAIPHLRIPAKKTLNTGDAGGGDATGGTAGGTGEDEIRAVVGWCRGGVADYESSDSKPVRLVVMYRVPDSQPNAYLSEISGLLRAYSKNDGCETVTNAADLDELTRKILSWR